MVTRDQVANNIDTQVRDAIEKMIDEINSSIEDVRTVVDSQLKAALQSVQADVKGITFLPQIQKSIAEIESAAAAPPPAAPDASAVKRALQAIERGKSQVDLLNGLLEEALNFGSRAAVLILRGETFSGWKGVGFSAHGGNDEAIKRFNAAPGLIPELDRVLRNEHVVVWDGSNLATRLGVGASARAVLVPMVIRDKVAAAVYVDAVAEDAAKLDVSALEVLVFATGLLIDTLAIRKKVPSPSLSEPGDLAASVAAPAPAAPRPAAPPPPAPRAATPAPPPPAAPRPVPVAPSAAPSSTTVAVSANQIRDMMASAAPGFNMPTADDFGGSAAAPTAVPPPRPSPPPPAPPPVAPRPAPAPAAAPATSPLGGADDKPTTQYIPPAGINRGGVLAGGGSEDTKKHDEARRFARLLVSEIKLYNESKVEQGRKNRDIYERLKEDIDRSRQMYDERIGEDVRKNSNYFYDELVRILADGKTESLGL